MYRLPLTSLLPIIILLLAVCCVSVQSSTRKESLSDNIVEINTIKKAISTSSLWRTETTTLANVSKWQPYGNNKVVDSENFTKIVVKNDGRGAYLYLDKIFPPLKGKDNKNYKITFSMYSSSIKSNSEVIVKFESSHGAIKYKISQEQKQYEVRIANTKQHRLLIKFDALAKGDKVYINKRIKIEQMIKRDYVQPFEKVFKGATVDMNRLRTVAEIRKWFFDLNEAGAQYIRIQANPKISMNGFSKMGYLADIVYRFNSKYLPFVKQYNMKVLFAMESIPYDNPMLKHSKNIGYWDNPETMKNFKDTAKYIANAFKNTHEIFALQFMSEPIDDTNQVPSNWYQISNEVIEVVRNYTDKFIAWSTGPGGRPSYDFFVPLEDNRIIYNFHEFMPYHYTHQGIRGNPLNVLYSSENKILIKDITSMVAFRERNNNIPIMCGSYALANWILDGSLWLKDLITLLQDNNISSFQFATGQFKAWDWRYRAINNGKKTVYIYDKNTTNKLWTVLSKYWKQ